VTIISSRGRTVLDLVARETALRQEKKGKSVPHIARSAGGKKNSSQAYICREAERRKKKML